MGQLSKDIMKKAKILPKLKLGIQMEGANGKTTVISTGEHRVKLISEKLINGKNFEGKEMPMVSYIFEEDGEQKQYNVPMNNKENSEPHYFVQAMSEINEGDEVILEMKKRGVKNYIKIQRNDKSNEEIEVDDDHETPPDDIMEGIV